jgi:hypothetical protein
VALALLCNLGSINPGVLANRVAALALGSAITASPADPASVAVDSTALSALAGAYFAPRTEQVLVLTARHGALTDSTGKATLISLSPTSFQYRGSSRTLTFVPGSGGQPVRLREEAPNTRPVEYVPVDRPRPDPAALAALAGEYRSPELDARLRFSVLRDTLRLDQGWQEAVPLTPLYRDGFDLGGTGIVRFVRDKRGRVTGMVLWAGRVRHLRFDRVQPR